MSKMWKSCDRDVKKLTVQQTIAYKEMGRDGICRVQGNVEPSVIGIGELRIIPAQRRVLKRNEEIVLTNIEFRILYVLATHQRSILSKEQIYNFVWNGEYFRDDSNITSHVRRLRKKIEDDSSKPTYIETVRGIGYRMNSIKKK